MIPRLFVYLNKINPYSVYKGKEAKLNRKELSAQKRFYCLGTLLTESRFMIGLSNPAVEARLDYLKIWT